MLRRAVCLRCSIQRATEEGLSEGRANRQHTYHVYCTSEEWLAWLAGWRQGQAERKRRLTQAPRWFDCGRHRHPKAA